MSKLAIRPSTRGLQSIGKRGFWVDQEYPKTRFFLKNGKITKNAKTQKRLEICQNQRYALRPEVSNPSGSLVSTMFCKAKSAKNKLFLRGDFRPLPNKNVRMLDHFFPLIFPKDSESLKIFDILLREVEAKRPLNGTSKVNRQTHGQTDRQTDISTYRKHRPRGPML